MSHNRKPPRPDIPDHVPDMTSLPPAPAPLLPGTVYTKGEIITFIATAMGRNPAEVADVTLICRMDDSLPATYFWNSQAAEQGTGQPERLKLLYNIQGQLLILLHQIIDEDEG